MIDPNHLAKPLHQACVAASIAGFVLRYALMLKQSPLLRNPWIRITPHLNDTVLLGAAVILVTQTEQYPFRDNWLTAKLIGLIAYIALGSIALKQGRTVRTRRAAGLAAIFCFLFVVSVAITRNPIGFWSIIGANG